MGRAPKGMFVVVVLVLFFAILVAASACRPKEATPAGPLAPDFTLKTLDGSSFTLSQQRGKVVILDFIIANCPSCAVEFPALARVYRDYADRGLEVLVLDINPYDREADLLEAKQHFGGGDHLWAIDEGQKVTLSYGVRSLGTTVIVSQQGRIVYTDSGPTSYEKLKEEVTRLIP